MRQLSFGFMTKKRYLVTVTLEQEIDAEDDEQAKEIMADILPDYPWCISNIERLDENE